MELLLGNLTNNFQHSKRALSEKQKTERESWKGVE